MGVTFDYRTINYRDQREFDYFFATAFDRYDTNRDGVIDYAEFQPLINDMCALITKRDGYGPTVDKIRAAWSALDFNKNGYITRDEFSYRAKYELERILTTPDYIPLGYTPTPTPFGTPYPPVPVAYGYGYPPVPYAPRPAYPPVVFPQYGPRIVSYGPFW